MRWETGRRSTNIQDMRGVRMGRGAGVAGLGGGGLLLVLLVALCTGRNPLELLGTEDTSSMVGAESGQVTDIFLPKWLASNIANIYGPMLALAIFLHARNLARR